MKIKLCFILIICVVVFISCSKGSGGNPVPPDPCAGLSFKFSTDVQPIFNTTCTNSSNCHGAGSNNSGGPLTGYNLVFAKRAEIKFQVSGGFMPKAGSITAEQKNKIICWINSGAPNN